MRNFGALAKKLAPDGKNVTLVGLTSHRPDRSREVALTRSREELRDLAVRIDALGAEASTAMPGHEPVEVKGSLHYADKIGGSDGTIKLEEQDGSVHEILVPEGLMTDIVRPLWDSVVTVTGLRHGQRIELKEIVAEEDQ